MSQAESVDTAFENQIVSDCGRDKYTLYLRSGTSKLDHERPMYILFRNVVVSRYTGFYDSCIIIRVREIPSMRRNSEHPRGHGERVHQSSSQIFRFRSP